MNKNIIQKLKEWRSKKSKEENVELFIILHNKTIETIAEVLPTNEEEFKAIKGLGGKKYEKYGKEIISIVNECLGVTPPEIEDKNQEKIYSVSDFLELINSALGKFHVRVKGEISSVDMRDNYLFFTIKDLEQESAVSCFMWKSDYEISDIDIKEGMEVIVFGIPEVYQRSGRFNLRTETIELVGEGALKKKYEELKKKLSSKGLFKESRKKPIPDFPNKIGLITSKDGAVIHDFQSNLGRFGYKITFLDSRVEGIMAVKDLINGVKYFKDKDIDVLVIIRGGGSLESLQPFNNETLIRKIIDYPAPVICGIGHDKDVPLFSMVADMEVSTPSIVAKELNETWERAIDKISYYESNIFHKYSAVISSYKNALEKYSYQINKGYQYISQKISSVGRLINNISNNFTHILKSVNEKIDYSAKTIINNFSSNMAKTNQHVDNYLKYINQNNPCRQLKLGYSILFANGRIIKSVEQLAKDDILTSRLNDGKVISKVQELRKR